MFSRTKRQQHWSIYPFVLATLAMSNSSITARSKRPPCVHIMRLLGRHSWVDWKQIYDAPKTSLDAMYFVCGASTSCRIIANPAVYAELWKRYVHLESAHSKLALAKWPQVAISRQNSRDLQRHNLQRSVLRTERQLRG